MNENNTIKEDMIRNVEDEASEVIDQIEKDISEGVSEEVADSMKDHTEDDIAVQTANEYFEAIEEKEEESKKKETKQQKAIRLVGQAKSIVEEADNLSSECTLLLKEDLAEYEDAKINLKEGGFDTCKALLESMGYRSTEEEPEEEAVVFESEVTMKPLKIKEVSSGKFTAVLSALVAGVVAAVGLVYIATEKLGMTLYIDKVPSPAIRENVLGWFSTLIGMESNMLVGTAVFGISVLLIMIIVYLLRVTLKTSSNLHASVKQFVEAELYAEQKTDCKVEMEKIDAHLKEAIKTFKTYEILFNEQQGKLQRILHIEGPKENATEYDERSYAEIRETKKLIGAIKDFIAVPMSKEGKLSEESELRLEKLKTQMDNMIDRLYGI